MTDYERIVDYAYRLLSSVHKQYLDGNSMAYPMLLAGMGGLVVVSRPENGHNYQAVSDAIHRMYKDDTRCKDGYEAGLFNLVEKINDLAVAQLVFNYLFYELKKQDEGTNSFVLSVRPIVQRFIDVLSKRKEDVSGGRADFIQWIDEHIELLSKYQSEKI